MAIVQNQTPQWPVYLPLKFDFDSNSLLEKRSPFLGRILSNKRRFWPAELWNRRESVFQVLLVGSEDLNREAPRLYVEDGKVQWKQESAKLFRGMNLTFLPGESESLNQAVHYDGEKFS